MTDEHDSEKPAAATEPESDAAAPSKRRRPVARGTSLRRPDTSSSGSKTSSGAVKPAPEEASRTAADSAEPEPAEAISDEREAAQARKGWRRPRWLQAPSADSNRLPIAMVAAAVVIGVLAIVVLAVRPSAQRVDNQAYVNTALTTQVTSVAKQAAKQIYTIDMNNLGPWEKNLATVVTPGMIDEAKKLRTAMTQSASSLKDLKVSVDDGDLTAGVLLARRDHAEVLLNVRQQVSTQGVPIATGQSPMKFVLDKFDGAWKVSSITPL